MQCSRIFLLGFSALLVACTSVAPYPDDAVPLANQIVNQCSFRAHLQCIGLTGKETLADGANLQWTRHWGRMSYIGQACEKQYGRTTGLILESLFAIPHYSAIAIGNSAATLAYPFRSRQPPLEGSDIGEETTPFPVGLRESRD